MASIDDFTMEWIENARSPTTAFSRTQEAGLRSQSNARTADDSHFE
jgi:hypothetical protein